MELVEKHHARRTKCVELPMTNARKEHGDRIVCAECCSNMWHELDAAEAETAQLFKYGSQRCASKSGRPTSSHCRTTCSKRRVTIT